MPFDLKVELEEIRRQLEAIGAGMTAGGEQLRQQADFGVRCLALAEKARALAVTLPPPEPSPPLTEQVFEVDERVLKRASWLRRQASRVARFLPVRWLFRRVGWKANPVDSRGMVPVRERSSRTLKLNDPRWPGSPATTVSTEVEVSDVLPLPWKRFRWLPAFWFLYEERQVPLKVTVHVDAVPPDAPLTPAQEAYRRRQKEVAEEVRDLTSFLKRLENQVFQLQAKMRTLLGAAEQLEQDVARLPAPEAHVRKLREIEAQFVAVEQGLPAVEQQINNSRPVLEDLKQQARKICPELQP